MSSSASEQRLEEVRAHYRRDFERFSARLPKGEAPWLGTLREGGIERFQSLGFPTTRHEDWRYTNVSGLAKQSLELADAPADYEALRPVVAASRVPGLDAELFVFVNGAFAAELSDDSKGGRFASLAALRSEDSSALQTALGSAAPGDDAFAALNTAFIDDGAVVHARAADEDARVLHLLFLSTAGGISHPRLLIVAEPKSRVCVVQDHVQAGSGDSVTNAVTEVSVGANASVELVLLQREGESAQLFTSTRARQDRDSRFASHTVTLGGRLVRNDLAATLEGEGAECALRGLFDGKGERHIDNHTLVDHATPHCSSDELYKGLLDDSSRGVFRGRVLVRRGAQKTAATQSNPNLLLSDKAEIDTRPQLEIYADDVKCNHGSSTGRLDPDALFYLRSRALGEAEARELLRQAFAFEITSALPRPELAEYVRTLLFEELASLGEELT